jgi:hypothetical protein
MLPLTDGQATWLCMFLWTQLINKTCTHTYQCCGVNVRWVGEYLLPAFYVEGIWGSKTENSPK